MGRLSVGQRTVIVVAFAIVLAVIWYSLAGSRASNGGWFGYSPTGRVYIPRGRGRASTALTWVLVTVVWAAISVWVLALSAPTGRGIRRLNVNREQRIVLVVALGAAAAITGGYLTRPTVFVRQLGGRSAVADLGPELGPLAAWLVGVALVVVWGVVSVRIFQSDEASNSL